MQENNNEWGTDIKELDEETTKADSSQLLKLDELTLDGETGDWSMKHLTQEKVKDENGKLRYPISAIEGSTVEVIIVKKGVKKTARKGDMGKMIAGTGEYIDKSKPAYFFTYGDKIEKSTIVPETITGEATGFKNSQICYVIYQGNLCRLVLNGKKVAKEKEIHGDKGNDFFNYIWSFKEAKKSYHVVTKIEAVKMKNPTNKKKIIYTCLFSASEQIQKGDERVEFIISNVNMVNDSLRRYFDSVPKTAVAPKPVVVAEDTDIIFDDVGPEDTGEVSNDDLPF